MLRARRVLVNGSLRSVENRQLPRVTRLHLWLSLTLSKVLVISACNNIIFIRRALEAGTSGYISKDTNADEMIKAIRLVSSGKKYVSSDMAQKIAVTKSEDSKSPFDKLSKRELQVMMQVFVVKK